MDYKHITRQVEFYLFIFVKSIDDEKGTVYTVYKDINTSTLKDVNELMKRKVDGLGYLEERMVYFQKRFTHGPITSDR